MRGGFRGCLNASLRMAQHQRGMRARGRDPGDLRPKDVLSLKKREMRACQRHARPGESEMQERTGASKGSVSVKELNTPFL